MGWLTKLSRAAALLSAVSTASSTISEGEAKSLIRRHLDQDNYGYNPEFAYDLTDFSLRFDRCQYVKMYDDELAQDEDSGTPLAVKHFVVFRLCPTDECDTCSETFGRYVTELDDYLASTAEAQANHFDYMCENCQEKCNEDGEYCSGCGKLCYRYQNLEADGYVDAADYIECQQLELNNDDNENDNQGDDDGFALYIGPRCSADGDRVLLGLFSDEDCLEPYTYAEPEQYLNANISYHLLAHTTSNDGSVCLSCAESGEDQENDNDQQDADADADEVNEMCENIYNEAAKCESKYGIDGFIQVNKEEDDFENQAENEFMVCAFIESLLWGSYTETGEINFDAEQDVIFRDVTGVQKAAVTILAISVGGLFAAAYFTQKEIDRTLPKINLISQTDAQFT
mmetsp:Transcript_32970/g.51113  ORF Transcript_32970/g.51113 Transcript_32970/m.51113 type:complete len:399 (-) Transcript_32970:175-1371(-)